ncbi:MAG: glutamate formimidoyltransferase [Thermoplasmatales archaeon]|jgi:glutamate formiminotransferase/formiminotetrahydrofolate cyclodeaminase|nr:glutamate formimidoyltransferase [Candidatus Thermoplasmatota archaeon]MDA8056294.1 glutamate formimidoyltransferase [Thermoplasmatales archaeon]
MNYVECVPNYSEGKDRSKIESIIDSIKKYPVDVIDVEMNADHNRSVVTVVGDGESMVNAMFESIKRASELIDLDSHSGEHPRFGATDVVPFVPMLGTTKEYCVELARRLGERVGKELGIPVFLYSEAANIPSRRELPDIRNEKFQYEQLKESIVTDEKYAPDFGPKRVGKAGATIIGAREFLIAFNVDLKTEDLRSTKEIAKRTRERTGGLKNVRALGFNLNETKETQVSMNLINHKETPVPGVFEFVKREAQSRGLPVSRTELVGMIPLQALEEIYRFYLMNREFSENQILEKKLLEIFSRDSIRGYIGELASDKPAPGGGSASAMVGSMGAALVAMVAGLTIGKKGYEEVSEKMKSMQRIAVEAVWQLYNQADKDTKAYDNLSKSLSMPKGTPEEKEARTRTIQSRLKEATQVPYATGKLAASMLEYLPVLIEKGNKNAVSDVYCAALFLSSAVYGSMQNVKINLGLIKDAGFIEDYRTKMVDLSEETRKKTEEILKNMWN